MTHEPHIRHCAQSPRDAEMLGPVTTRPAARSRTALGLVSGVAVAGAAAAIVVMAAQAAGPGSSSTNRPAQGAAGPAAARTTSALAHAGIASSAARPGGSVLYVHNGSDQIWIPADRSGTWQFNRPGWQQATNSRAECAAFPFLRTSGISVRTANGEHKVVGDHVPSCSQGDWVFYRPAFTAALPDDPADVLASMRRSGSGDRDVDAFVTGSGFVSEGWVDPDGVGKVVAALKLLPGTRVRTVGAGTESLSYTGDSKPGVAETHTIVVDTHNRVIAAGGHLGPGAGHLTRITYRTVDALGASE